eukprot:TRINITY_DN18276_c0_g3_i1.p1 TRINITY_DN18276_c0_g3~~TRINITY_DN18276_c0_g3_i1.p1  ORF type:complete len:2412 (-),score=485.57 TRINITY_DN18276_c0_g3_i1:104-7339(-)
MPLSELLRSAQFPVAAGLSPSIAKLHDAVDTVTRDWTEAAVGSGEAGDGEEDIDSPLHRDPGLQAVILRYWDQFKHGPGNVIEREEYELFLLRCIRVLLPGLVPEHERSLVSNTWLEDTCGLDHLPFSMFFNAMVRFARTWRGTDDPALAATFLEDLFARITCPQVLQADETVIDKDPAIIVSFRPDDAGSSHTPECDFGASVTVETEGELPTFKVTTAVHHDHTGINLQAHLCIFTESIRDAHEDHLPADAGVSYKWTPLEEIVPMGMAALAAMRQAEHSSRETGETEVDSAGISPEPADAIEAFLAWVTRRCPTSNVLSCRVDAKGKSTARDVPNVTVEASGRPLGIMDILSVGVNTSPAYSTMIMQPENGSMLYRLAKLRSALKGVLGSGAADAAFPGFAVANGGAIRNVHLCSFPEVLEGAAALEPASGLVKLVKDESLLMYGSLSCLAEISMKDGLRPLPTTGSAVAGAVAAEGKKSRTTTPTEPLQVHDTFPDVKDCLENDMEDVIALGNTPPVTLWVIGDCDAKGDYKTETCRRLAKRMGVQWLKPAYLLELATKTPAVQRTPLMARCAELLQRGMAVPTADVLKLAHEMMSSTLCKTNGYVLELPPLTAAEIDVVQSFAAQVRELSCMTQVSASCPLISFVEAAGFQRPVLAVSANPLPVMKPDSEPPRPPPEQAEPPAEAPAEDGEAPEEGGATESAPVQEEVNLEVATCVEVKAALYSAQGAQFEIGEGWTGTVDSFDADGDALIRFDNPGVSKYVLLQDFVALKVVPPRGATPAEEGAEDGAGVEPAAAGAADAADPSQAEQLGSLPELSMPNPWMDTMPRRLVVLSAEADEFAAWKLAQLQQKHADRARRLKELEEAGEEVPEEPEEDVIELEALPEDEGEQAEVFQKHAGDVLLAMEKYVPAPSREPPTKLPALPDASKNVEQEHQDRHALKSSQEAAAKALQDKFGLPLLSLHADSRPPEEMAELLAATTSDFGRPLALLPTPLDGAAAGSLGELLRCPATSLQGAAGSELDERQASRLWSRWRQHCPVALVEKRVRPGEEEQSANAKKYNLHNMMDSLCQQQVLRGDQNFAVNYAGRVFMLSGEQEMRKFCTWPKRYLANSPRINAPSLCQGMSLLGPCRFRCSSIADGLAAAYGFDIIDPVRLVDEAMQKPSAEILPSDASEEMKEAAAGVDNRLKLSEEEKQAVLTGQALGKDTLFRLIAEALGVERNIRLVSERDATIERQKQELEAAKEKEEGTPAGIVVDEDSGMPVVDYSEPLVRPSRGFVLLGFPETAEQLQELRTSLRIQVDRVVVLKKGAPAATEVERAIQAEKGDAEEVALMLPEDVLAADGFYADGTEAALEAAAATLSTFEGVEGLTVAEVPLEVDEHAQVIAVRKLIDPFYTVVEEPSVGLEIPDPEGWTEPDPVEPEEGQEPPEPVERPTIPWGVLGPYCPVTFKEDFWLFPGQKELQNVVMNSVYSFASERSRDAFLAEPIKYLPVQEPALPPPRVLITGPTGSGVARHCEALAEVYRLPVLKLEDLWLKRIGVKIEARKASRKSQDALAKAEEEAMQEDGAPAWPAGWKPPEPKEEGEEAQEEDAPAEAEPEPEDDGFEDADAREALYVEALRDVLGAHCGGCIIDGSFFGNAEVNPSILTTVHVTPDVWEEMKEKRSLQNMLLKAQRFPDIAIVLRCKHDIAAKATYDFAKIDKEFEDKVEQLKAALAEFDTESENPPPDPTKYGLPEGFNPEEEQEEKESQRVRTEFVKRKLAEEGDLKEFVVALKAARAPVEKIIADRGNDPTHKAVRWHCRRYLEHRANLLLEAQTVKVTLGRRADRLQRSLALPSRFGDASPMISDGPLFVGLPDTYKYGVELRRRVYYPRNSDEQERFLAQPQDFLSFSTPSRVAVHPAIVVTGPPLAGKTELAQELAKRTGAVYLSIPDIVERLCGLHAPASSLSRSLSRDLNEGGKAADEAIVTAIRHRLAAPDVLARGWILDDFPLTASQARQLAEVGVVPHRLIVLKLTEGHLISRCSALASRSCQGGGDALQNAVQQEIALQRKRTDAYSVHAPQLRKYYGLAYNNILDINGCASRWAICDKAFVEISAAVSQRLEYYRRTSNGQAAKIRGLCFPSGRFERRESAWRRYCPVRLTLENDLVRCTDRECCVECNSKIYWLSSPENAEFFIEDPNAFLQVPLPESTPQALPPTRVDGLELQLEGNCPVTLVDTKELHAADGHHVVEFQGKYWGINGKTNRDKFMRRPLRYVSRAKLPNKRPPQRSEDAALLASMIECRGGKRLEPADMLAYMQSCVAETICQALVESGEQRPLCPGKTPQESALLFLSSLLRARNPLNTDLHAAKMKSQFDALLSDCALPTHLRESINKKCTQQASEWTGSDSRRHSDLCNRFDHMFKAVP